MEIAVCSTKGTVGTTTNTLHFNAGIQRGRNAITVVLPHPVGICMICGGIRPLLLAYRSDKECSASICGSQNTPAVIGSQTISFFCCVVFIYGSDEFFLEVESGPRCD